MRGTTGHERTGHNRCHNRGENINEDDTITVHRSNLFRGTRVSSKHPFGAVREEGESEREIAEVAEEKKKVKWKIIT